MEVRIKVLIPIEGRRREVSVASTPARLLSLRLRSDSGPDRSCQKRMAFSRSQAINMNRQTIGAQCVLKGLAKASEGLGTWPFAAQQKTSCATGNRFRVRT